MVVVVVVVVVVVLGSFWGAIFGALWEPPSS